MNSAELSLGFFSLILSLTAQVMNSVRSTTPNSVCSIRPAMSSDQWETVGGVLNRFGVANAVSRTLASSSASGRFLAGTGVSLAGTGISEAGTEAEADTLGGWL